MRQITQFKWVKRPGAEQIVHEAMQPSVRFALSDILELPATVYQDRTVEPEPEARRAYKIMFDKMRLITKNGEVVTAANEGVLNNKLLQVSLGYIYSDKRGVLKLPNDSRLDAVREIVVGTRRKVICFLPFIHALEGLAEELQKHTTIAVVNGSTPIGLRNKIFKDFQEKEDPHCLIAHPQCMSHGLTLTAASTIVWVGPTMSYETYEQANARIIRPGQTSKTLIVHIIGTPVERLAYRRLGERGMFQGMLLELFKEQDLDLVDSAVCQ